MSHPYHLSMYCNVGINLPIPNIFGKVNWFLPILTDMEEFTDITYWLIYRHPLDQYIGFADIAYIG